MEISEQWEARYDSWLTEMQRINPMDLPFFVGTEHEPETTLTSQDLKELDARTKEGEWRLNVVESGTYQISFLIKELNAPTTVELRIDNEPIATLAVDKSKERYAFEPIELREGRRTLRVIPHGVDSRYLHAFISRQN
jgi:hypothetical protein